MRNAKCASTQNSMEWLYCSFLYCADIPANPFTTSAECCFSSTVSMSENDLEENDGPLNEHRQATHETCLQSVLPNYPVTIQCSERNSLGDEIYNIAPGESRHPVSIMTDKKCEELVVRVLNGQKYMFTYHIEGQFCFMLIL